MKGPDLRIPVIAIFISDFGTSLTLAALPLLFLNIGRSDGIGIFNGWDSLGALLGSFLATGIVDRVSKNKLASFTNLALAAVMAVFVLLPSPPLEILIGFALFKGFFTAIQDQSQQVGHVFELPQMFLCRPSTGCGQAAWISF